MPLPLADRRSRPPLERMLRIHQALHSRSYPNATSLAGDVIDTNMNETLTFSKLSGPAWVSVTPEGGVVGTPGPGDLGMNTFAVRVTDTTGFADEAAVRLFVWDPTPPGLGISLGPPQANLQLQGTVGQHYRIEFQPALPPPGSWLVLTDIVSLAVSPLMVSDLATNHQRFYRAASIP